MLTDDTIIAPRQPSDHDNCRCGGTLKAHAEMRPGARGASELSAGGAGSPGPGAAVLTVTVTGGSLAAALPVRPATSSLSDTGAGEFKLPVDDLCQCPPAGQCKWCQPLPGQLEPGRKT